MKHTVPVLRILAFGALAFGALPFGTGCVHRPSVSAATFEGPAARVVELPVSPGPGANRQVNMVVDEPSLRLATIVLREGTTLPEHRSPVAVTIQALAGSGSVIAEGVHHPIDVSHAVVLAPNVPHAVHPESDELVLLVHHAGLSPEAVQ